jgi:hypothetical protein
MYSNVLLSECCSSEVYEDMLICSDCHEHCDVYEDDE